MEQERRRDERFETPAIGLLRNLTQHTEPQIAMLRNLSKGGFLVETRQDLRLNDAIELRLDGLTFLGEVVHYRPKREGCLAGVRIEYRLEDEELRLILEPH